MVSLQAWRQWPAAVLVMSAMPGLLAGSAVAQALRLTVPAGAAETADFDVYFGLRDREAAAALIAEQTREGSPQYHKWLTPQDFIERFGPDRQAVAAAAGALAGLGLNPGRRSGLQLHVEASAGAVEAAFGVRLRHGQFADGSEALVADRKLRLPPLLARAGAVIAQFTTVPPADKHSRILEPGATTFQSPVGPFYTADLRQAYDYPDATAADGSGATIGILISNDVLPSDITTYFANEGAAGFAPTLSVVPIDSGAPFGPNASGEATLDIQQSAGMALNTTVILYNLHNLSPPVIMAGLNRIIGDNQVDVVNMSFGVAEIHMQQSLVQAYDNLFMQGSAQGITFVASTGDNGAALDPSRPSTTTADHPATDPFVTAVGGTNLVTALGSGSADSSYVSENAEPDPQTPQGCRGSGLPSGCIWGSTGGDSIFFPRPAYQKRVPTGSTTARTVPDAAGHMGGCFPGDPSFVQPCGPDRSHDFTVIAGKTNQIIGTSASSPDFAGLVAIAVTVGQSRLGPVNPLIYRQAEKQIDGGPAAFHHRRIVGNNGIFTVQVPYDRVIGNGTVDGRRLFGLTGLPPAGPPGSAGNP